MKWKVGTKKKITVEVELVQVDLSDPRLGHKVEFRLCNGVLLEEWLYKDEMMKIFEPPKKKATPKKKVVKKARKE